MRHSLGGGHNLGQSSLLQPRAVLCEECSWELPEAAAPASEEESRMLTVNRGLGKSLQGATIYGVTEKSVNYKSGALGFGPGFANTLGP